VLIATILATAAFSPTAPAQPAAVGWPDGVWEYEGYFKKKGGLFGPFQFQHSFVAPIAGGGSKVRLGGVGGSLAGTCIRKGRTSATILDFFYAPNFAVSVAPSGRFSLTRPSPFASLGRGRFTLEGKFTGPSAANVTGTVTMTQHQVLGAKCKARGTFRGKRTYQVA
jgi:hypothetical protein